MISDRELLEIIKEDGCDKCGSGCIEPVWFKEEEERVSDYGFRIKTGRVRTVCSHLQCQSCGTNIITDGEFLSGMRWEKQMNNNLQENGFTKTPNFNKVVEHFKEYHVDKSEHNFPRAHFNFGKFKVSMVTEKYYKGDNNLEFALIYRNVISEPSRYQTVEQVIEFINFVRVLEFDKEVYEWKKKIK